MHPVAADYSIGRMHFLEPPILNPSHPSHTNFADSLTGLLFSLNSRKFFIVWRVESFFLEKIEINKTLFHFFHEVSTLNPSQKKKIQEHPPFETEASYSREISISFKLQLWPPPSWPGYMFFLCRIPGISSNLAYKPSPAGPRQDTYWGLL